MEKLIIEKTIVELLENFKADKTDEILNNIYLDKQQNHLVATNGKRLVVIISDTEIPFTGTYKIIAKNKFENEFKVLTLEKIDLEYPDYLPYTFNGKEVKIFEYWINKKEIISYSKMCYELFERTKRKIQFQFISDLPSGIYEIYTKKDEELNPTKPIYLKKDNIQIVLLPFIV